MPNDVPPGQVGDIATANRDGSILPSILHVFF